jgi:hypothetical protein
MQERKKDKHSDESIEEIIEKKHTEKKGKESKDKEV